MSVHGRVGRVPGSLVTSQTVMMVVLWMPTKLCRRVGLVGKVLSEGSQLDVDIGAQPPDQRSGCRRGN